MDTWFGSVYNTTAQHDYRNRIGGWGDRYFTLLRFDLSGLPLSATSVKILRHTINEGTPTAINWYKVTAPWQSGTVTYSNFQWSAMTLQYSFTAPNPGLWYATDITTLYNQWRTGTTKNYGVMLVPVSTNNNWSSFYSSKQAGYEPRLQVTYTPQSNDGVIKLKWPLATAKPASPSSAFGDPWGVGETKCKNLAMTHAGVDIPSAAGSPVYAAEDGFVREIFPASQSGGWASAIVLEHNHPVSGKYTTVYWHVTPASGIVTDSGSAKTFIPKGRQIATVADLTRAGDHLHFGVRLGAFSGTYSDKGALPTGACTELTSFPENFINPWSTSKVIFQ
jgi:murein DD-endopeptidase MepM/ murein hydrolase activator NlpD